MKKHFIRILCVCLSAITTFSFLGNVVPFASQTNNIEILSQPTDSEVQVGERAYFSLTASGTDISYQWQLSSDNGKSWENSTASGNKTNTVSFPVSSYSYKLCYRCVVTDSSQNNAVSDICRVIKPVFFKPLEITEQPTDTEVQVGERAYFSLTASGTDISYQWQLSSDNGKSWENSTASGNKTNTVSFPVSSYSYKLCYRCVVTDSSQNNAVSDICRVIEPVFFKPLEITEQPTDTEVQVGERAYFSLTASGTDISYKWQLSADNGISWENSTASGNKTNTVSFPVNVYSYNRLYRCIVTDSQNNYIFSNTVKVSKPQIKTFTLNNYDEDNNFCSNDADLIVSTDAFLNNCNLISESSQQKASVKYFCSNTVSSSDLLILKFTAKAADKTAKISVSINGNEITSSYPVYTQTADFYVPITKINRLSSVEITLDTQFQNITISDFQIANFYSQNITELKAGIYLKDAVQTPVSETSSFGEASTASVADNNYLYSVCRGYLNVYKINSNSNPENVATLEGLGTCHDIAFINGGKGLIITARENGAFLVDITNPENPVLASEYATLEMATGLAVSSHYAFICSRYFGIEIIDVSDIYNPKYYSQVSNLEEMYDCCVNGNYLYIGIWGQKNVSIYDISDLRNPQFINTILLDGNAGGIDVENNMLYVATGYHSRYDSTSLSSVGFGMGNGMEIYDISNPYNPIWLSTNKIDGRYKYIGNDYWKIKVSGNYAILASTYCGAYIYDISDPDAPLRINHLPIIIEKTSANYKAYSNGNYIFNFDTDLYNQAALISISTSKDKLFFGDPNTGIYSINLSGLEGEKDNYSANLTGTPRQNITAPQIEGYNSTVYSADSSVYRAIAYNDNIYAATSDGIEILNTDGKLIFTYETNSPVKDIVISSDGKYLYTAECENGVGIYSVIDNKIIKISHVNSPNNALYDFTITSISLSADETTLLCQSGFSRLSYVDIRNKTAPSITNFIAGGTMYYRNLCQGTVDGKYLLSADGAKIFAFSSSDGILTKEATYSNIFASEVNGISAYKNGVIAVYKNGYSYFDISDKNLSASNIKINKIPGIPLKGKPAVYDNIMVVSYCPNGEVYIIDISDINNPILIGDIKAGQTVDVASVYSDLILIPMRNDGLLILEKNDN